MVKFYDLYNLKLKQVMRNITRKLVTKDWVHVPPRLVSGVGGELGRPMKAIKLDIIFWGITVGRFRIPLKPHFCLSRNTRVIETRASFIYPVDEFFRTLGESKVLSFCF